MTDAAPLTAGRELDRLIAERVMGWQRYVDGDDWAWGNPEGDDFPEPPAYSTDIAAAWAIVEHLRAHGFDAFSLAIDNDIPGQAWRAMFYGERRYFGHGESPSIAICRAALAVVTGPS